MPCAKYIAAYWNVATRRTLIPRELCDARPGFWLGCHSQNGKIYLMATAEQWLGKLAHLKVDKARGDAAPHKPLLLLVVLELAEQGQAFGDSLALTPELAFRFCTYWSIVAQRRTQAPDVRYPFYHLKSDGFWSPLGEDGKPAPDRRLVRYASLPMDFVAFAKDPACRDQTRRILIAKYFQPSERAALYDLERRP